MKYENLYAILDNKGIIFTGSHDEMYQKWGEIMSGEVKIDTANGNLRLAQLSVQILDVL